jgi:hypothetical protein
MRCLSNTAHSEPARLGCRLVVELPTKLCRRGQLWVLAVKRVRPPRPGQYRGGSRPFLATNNSDSPDERLKRSATALLFGTRRLSQKNVADRLAKVSLPRYSGRMLSGSQQKGRARKAAPEWRVVERSSLTRQQPCAEITPLNHTIAVTLLRWPPPETGRPRCHRRGQWQQPSRFVGWNVPGHQILLRRGHP